MWLVTKFISPTPSFSFISSSEYEVGMGNWIDRLENWRSLCSDLAKPKLHAGLKSCPFSLWAVLRKVSHWGYKTCVSHGCPALLVHGAARLCRDKRQGDKQAAEGWAWDRTEQRWLWDQHPRKAGVPMVAAASWVSCSPDRCTLPLGEGCPRSPNSRRHPSRVSMWRSHCISVATTHLHVASSKFPSSCALPAPVLNGRDCIFT